MKQFRFIGGEDSIYWGIFEPNQFYDEDFKEPSFPAVIELTKIVPQDWEEVTEQEEEVQIHNLVIHSKTETTRIPNQDQPSSSMTKFEMAVFMAIQGLTANQELLANSHEDNAEKAIEQATELFKQLEKLKK